MSWAGQKNKLFIDIIRIKYEKHIHFLHVLGKGNFTYYIKQKR